MSVESAADLAAMFSESDFAAAALYTPPGGGAAIACSIVLDLARREDFEAEGGRGGARAVIAGQRAMILADQVPVVAVGGVFSPDPAANSQPGGSMGGRSFRVAGEPDLDETGRIWTADLAEVA